ncbi:MAG TPA: preprotein translocase subunit SecY, partial [Candidatus Magasanikbacteria bacterium]|nr:preprotein translocase subunit SecY [Candidatus Magasanikbacteria bacterium]
MWEKISQIWKIKDLRQSIIFVLAMLVIFRLAAHIPVPGVDVLALRKFFQSNQILGLMNIFSGGTMENFSVIMLGVAPYITASIIFQLLAMIIPSLEEMSKEGESGQRRINQYTRWLAVPLAFLQSYGMIMLLKQSARGIVGEMDFFRLITTMVTITAGTIFLMWIGELISEKNVGNGISLLIFAGIVSALPGKVQQMLVTFDSSQLVQIILFIIVAVITIVGVVFVTEGQRNIPVSYARQVRGNRVFGGQTTHLPLRVNMAGVIPIIFALSIMLFPQMVATVLSAFDNAILHSLSSFLNIVFANSWVYSILYFALVFLFTYFYTAVTFDPDTIATNLQKNGAFIPGVRPGTATAAYIGSVTTRITLVGAVFLALVAVLPLAMQGITGNSSLAIGGTALLIV